MLHTNLAISCYHIIYRSVFFFFKGLSGRRFDHRNDQLRPWQWSSPGVEPHPGFRRVVDDFGRRPLWQVAAVDRTGSRGRERERKYHGG